MALQPTRPPRLVLLVLLVEQPALLAPLPAERPELAELAPLRAELRQALQAPRMQALRLAPLERMPVLQVQPVPRQARRPRSRPRVQQLRQPRRRRCPRSTT